METMLESAKTPNGGIQLYFINRHPPRQQPDQPPKRIGGLHAGWELLLAAFASGLLMMPAIAYLIEAQWIAGIILFAMAFGLFWHAGGIAERLNIKL